MASESPTLPIGPFEHAAMDYARLRAEGIALLGRLAGAQWTDFNTHDPGITILEQLCYAITDLGYRIAHPMPDLLAGAGLGLPGPAAILLGDPVSAADLRKLVLDVEGIDNAWIEAAEPELPVYFHAGSGELRLRPSGDEADARPVRLRGLERVMLQTSDRLSGDAALDQVAARLHRSRALGADFQVALLDGFEVTIEAAIEVGPIEDASEVLADILEQLEAYLAPPVRFTALADARARGHRLDELLEGPLLERGVVLGPLPQPRRMISVSDLIHVITDVPAVRAVRSIELSSSTQRGVWTLDIPSGHVATLVPDLTLLRAGLPVRVDMVEVQRRLAARRAAASASTRTSESPELRPPEGRDRRLARHSSIQHQLPAAYGVGALGLPDSASAERKAQARQLEGYLLIFDQLLANAFAQLAHAHELLSPSVGSTRSYFAQVVEDPRLRLHELVRLSSASQQAWLDDKVESLVAGSDPLERRKRFLTHLLARFAEQLGDHALIDHTNSSDHVDAQLIRDRQALLRDYPRLSSTRGSGYDLFAGTRELSGLEQRIRLSLGLPDQRGFVLVEHVLLRPIPEDARQLGDEADPLVPLLAGVAGPDPWSLQISFVFEDLGSPDEHFEQLVARTILDETPAHLSAQLHWLGGEGADDHWAAFVAAWQEFQATYRAYRVAKLRASSLPDELHIALRDARDRVIDLLGIGQTYPLRDLPLPEHVIVPPGAPTQIPLALSQRGVLYELRDRRTGAAITIEGKPVVVAGTGGTIELPTPPIDEDVSYRVLAVKLEPGSNLRREAWLHGTVSIEEGVDPTLIAQIRQPVLNQAIDAPRPDDARIADYGAKVEVEVLASQEGVVYELLNQANHKTVLSKEPVVGTGGTIVLETEAIKEDVDLRVRGSKALGDPSNPDIRTALLDLILPLRIRANPALAVELVAGPIVEHGAGATLRVAATQKSASYRVFRRRIRDSEFVFEANPASPVITVAGDGGRTIRVLRPEKPATWVDLAGFEPISEGKQGTGSAIEIPLPAATDDAVLLVQASKQHRQGPLKAAIEADLAPPIGSAVQLDVAQALLVRPNRRPGLRMRAEVSDTGTKSPILQMAGQPGVYYQLQQDQEALARPGYFHQRDDVDARFNKGIGQLRVEVDLSIARDPYTPTTAPATTAPSLPLLDTGSLAFGTVLTVLARKAMTGLEAQLEGTATIAAVSAISVAQASVPKGSETKVVIAASVAGEHYRLLNGEQVLAEADGNGATLELATGPLEQSVVLVVAVSVETVPIVFVRRVSVAITVQA